MAKLTLQYVNLDDLIKLLLLFKEYGMEHLIDRPVGKSVNGKRKWKGIGAVDLKEKLATIPNLRDFAY